VGRRDRLSLGLCAGALATAVLAIGSAPRWAQAIVAVLAAAALATLVSSRRGFDRRPPLVILFLAAAAWSLVQWLPLPGGLAGALSPMLDALRTDGAAIAGVDVASSLSMDRPGSLRGVTFFLTLSVVAVLGLRLSISERGRYALVAMVAGSAGLAALVCGLHELFGATRLFGLYAPRDARPVVLGPLLNTNHLGCLMAIGVAASVGLILYPKQRSNLRALWVVVALGCTVTALASLSRGAVISLAIGVAVVLLVLGMRRMHALGKRSRRPRARFLTTTVPVAVMVVCALTVAVYIGAGSVMTQLENTSLDEIEEPTSKFAAWRSSVHLIEEAPWVGVGRGAFEPSFTRVHPASALATFSNPENQAIQLLVEMGLPVALLLGGLVIWILSAAVSRWHDGPLAAGALGAVAAVGFQSNFDFGLELLGIAVPVTLLLATLTYVPLAERSGPPRARMRATRAVHAALVLGGAALLATSWTKGVDEDHVALASQPSRASISAAIERHPLDYLAYGVLAEQLVRDKNADAVRVLNHALRLHPTHAGLHRFAARLLLRAGRVDQARLEYAAALRWSMDPQALLVEVTAQLQPLDAALAIPVELDTQRVTQLLDAAERHEVSLLWLQRVVADRRSLRAAEALYARAMRVEDYRAAEVAVTRRCEMLPSPRCQLDLARVLSAAGKPQGVISTLEDVATWTGRTDDKLAAWLLLCDAHAAVGDREQALECLRRVDVSGLLPPDHPHVRQRRKALETPPPGR